MSDDQGTNATIGDNPQTEELSLQEPNAQVWERARKPLTTLCHGDDHGTAIVMSGGAVLGARWRHRMSMDVDVHLRRIASFTILRPGREHGARLDALMREAGGRRIMTEDIQIKYKFNEGELDLIAGNLFPTPRGTDARIDGNEAEVASTAQIVATKIRARGRRAPARDLFDIAVAEREDPTGCEAGINAIPASELRDIEAIWKRGREALAADAKTLIEPAERFADIAADPAKAACATLNRLVWRTMRLEYGTEGARLVGQRGTTTRVLASGINTEGALDEAIITNGAYEDPLALRFEQAERWGKIIRAQRGEAVAPDEVKRVELEGDQGRGLTRAEGMTEPADLAALRKVADNAQEQHREGDARAKALLSGAAKAALETEAQGTAPSARANHAIGEAKRSREARQSLERRNPHGRQI